MVAVALGIHVMSRRCASDPKISIEKHFWMGSRDHRIKEYLKSWPRAYKILCRPLWGPTEHNLALVAAEKHNFLR